MPLAKAKILILEGRNANKTVEVLFNPAEYRLEVVNNYPQKAPPGLTSPIVQFVNSIGDTLSMDLYFDTHTDGGSADVKDQTKQFVALMRIDGKIHAPPLVEFQWGSLTFRAVVEKLSQHFTMFRADGIPVRAKLSITFKARETLSAQLKNPRPNSADKTKRRRLTADSSIWLLANDEFEDPRFWRLIARQNRIEDPRAIPAGTVLVVPPLTDFKTEAPS